MSAVVSLGLLLLGPFVAIAFVARNGNFRVPRLAVAAVIGELVGIVIWVGLNRFLAARVLAGKQSGLVAFFPPSPSSLSDRLVTLAFILAYALAAAATVVLGRWAYVRATR